MVSSVRTAIAFCVLAFSSVSAFRVHCVPRGLATSTKQLTNLHSRRRSQTVAVAAQQEVKPGTTKYANAMAPTLRVFDGSHSRCVVLRTRSKLFAAVTAYGRAARCLLSCVLPCSTPPSQV
eukprot:4833791-Pleurochrysis_carterae.AAC.3